MAGAEAGSLCTLLSGNSVPALRLHIPPGPLEEFEQQQQRSRSQSLDRKSNKMLGGSRKRCRNPSVTQPLSPSHSSPQKSLSESHLPCLSFSLFLCVSLPASVSLIFLVSFFVSARLSSVSLPASVSLIFLVSVCVSVPASVLSLCLPQSHLPYLSLCLCACLSQSHLP